MTWFQWMSMKGVDTVFASQHIKLKGTLWPNYDIWIGNDSNKTVKISLKCVYHNFHWQTCYEWCTIGHLCISCEDQYYFKTWHEAAWQCNPFNPLSTNVFKFYHLLIWTDCFYDRLLACCRKSEAYLGNPLCFPAMKRPDLHILTTDIECKVAGRSLSRESHP
jgi:hypothetical protein